LEFLLSKRKVLSWKKKKVENIEDIAKNMVIERKKADVVEY